MRFLQSDMRLAVGGPKEESLEPIILKAWSPGAQTIPMAIFSNFKRLSLWSPEKHTMEPWSTAILSLGARSPLKYALDTRSLRTLRGPHVGDLETLTKHALCSSLRGVSPLSLSNKNPVRLLGKEIMFSRKIHESTLKIPLLLQMLYALWKRDTTPRRSLFKEN